MYRPATDMESAFSDAAIEYRWLLNRNYSNSAALKLVGDKHQLPRDERLILFRGIAPFSDAIRRRKLISTGCRGLELFVDGYNQILTVMHYLSGRPVFLADDGFLRDAGASHGRISRPELFELAMKLLAESLVQAGPASVSAFFDSPVAHSAKHTTSFSAILSELGMKANAILARDPDAVLKKAPTGTVVASSDSSILDALAEQSHIVVFDAARATLDTFKKQKTGASEAWFDLASLV